MFSMQDGCGEAVPCSRAQPGLKDAEAVKRRWCQRSVLRAQQASPQLCKYMRSLAGRKGEASGVWAVPLFAVFPPCACRDHSISHRGHPTPHPAPGLTITAPPGASNHCKKHCCNFFIEAFCGILFFVSFFFHSFLICAAEGAPQSTQSCFCATETTTQKPLFCHWGCTSLPETGKKQIAAASGRENQHRGPLCATGGLFKFTKCLRAFSKSSHLVFAGLLLAWLWSFQSDFIAANTGEQLPSMPCFFQVPERIPKKFTPGLGLQRRQGAKN